MSNYQQPSKMNFITKQSKLTKDEWTNIEVPCSDSEKRILSLIEDGYNNVNIRRNYTLSLARHVKITHPEKFAQYLYDNYFQKHMDDLCKKYKQFFPKLVDMINGSVKKFGGGSGVGSISSSGNKQPILKKADIIRIENTSKNIDEHKHTIFEYILIDLLEKMLSKKYLKKGTTKNKKNINDEWLFECYTIHRLLSYTVEDKNPILCSQMEQIINYVINESLGCIEEMLSQSYLLIEKNDYLLKHADETLYDHQKELFSVCKHPTPKLVLYIAPTGTGKTMSPLGLSTNHRVIFVCAARHVGLSLAKAAISMHKKIAFAFGCNDAEDIRLHYFAAKEYTKNAKSGGIGKVDNTQGEKVEIMISDVQSYLPAMLYMLAFNPKEKIITYWDEPTIAMDYPEHELHAMINKNWTENLIPNMVLSSATLPQRNEITDTIMDFCGRFADVDVHEIISYDCKKTIPLLNREGFIEMPHYLHSEYEKVLEVVEHCKIHKTLLRYIDLSEAVKFILTVQRLQKEKDDNKSNIITNIRYTVETHFIDINTLTMANIKMFYLDLLGNLNPDAYPLVYNELCGLRKKAQESNVNIVTTDAHTLTDGPTIFLADDIHKIAQFYIQSAKIPSYVLKEVMDKIVFNRNLHEQIKVLEKDLEDATTSTTSDGTKKDKITRDDKLSPELKEKKQKLNTLNSSIQTIILTPTYVPNTRDHLYKYAAKMEHTNAFTCDISEETVEQIMRIMDVEDYWKLLLLMGIGVFAEHKSVRYTEVMKKLAQEQKLFMIIASSDYIYGTNYQFCHGYIGKDLGDMTQEKCIQSMGRVGRNKLQQNYSVRFRDNALIYKLFHRDDNKPEVENMNRLFNTL